MKLPRRVPWTSIGELEQVCNWIFTDETDLNAQSLAINRLAAWKQITALPHALDATLGLLSVLISDTPASTNAPGAGLRLRQSYAAALIRLVNGLVDPLQLGAYARSIAAIAAQLELPAWLIDLRHAATHEELPSLAVLREGARQSMTWLLHNYFLPQLRPANSTAMARKEPSVRPLAPLLKEYKALLKATTRDVSLRRQHEPRLTAMLRDAERWVAEAKVAADVASGDALGWGGKGEDGGEGNGEEEDARERWALERLADALVERGALVPVAKKKRAVSTDFFHPPPALVAIWTPLLTHLHLLHPTLPSALVDRILTQLLSPPEASSIGADAEDVPKADPSYDLCLAAWVTWLVDTYHAAEDVEGGDERALRRTDVVVALLNGVGPVGAGESGQERKAVHALLHALSSGRPELESAVSSLLPQVSDEKLANGWTESDLATMNGRLQSLADSLAGAEADDSVQAALGADAIVPDAMAVDGGPAAIAGPRAGPELPDGWRLLDGQSGWRPAPIGVFVPCAN